jgi:hypothetical protein
MERDIIATRQEAGEGEKVVGGRCHEFKATGFAYRGQSTVVFLGVTDQ